MTSHSNHNYIDYMSAQYHPLVSSLQHGYHVKIFWSRDESFKCGSNFNKNSRNFYMVSVTRSCSVLFSTWWLYSYPSATAFMVCCRISCKISCCRISCVHYLSLPLLCHLHLESLPFVLLVPTFLGVQEIKFY